MFSTTSEDEINAAIHALSSGNDSMATLPSSIVRMIINFAMEEKWWSTLRRITGMKQVKAYCFMPRVCRGLRYLHTLIFLPWRITIKFWQHGWHVYNPTDSLQSYMLLEGLPKEWMVCCHPKASCHLEVGL